MIVFRCKNCGQRFSASGIDAGKKGKCPKCKSIVIVPEAETTSSNSKQRESLELKAGSKNSVYDSTLLDISEGIEIQNSVLGEIFEDTRALECESPVGEIEKENRYKLPLLIDVFLYPTSVSGLIHLAIFLFGPPLAWVFLNPLARTGFFFVFVPLCIVVYLLLVSSMLYYIAFCIVDSVKGSRRAPDITTQSLPDKGELVWQLFLVLGAVAICFWPAAIYYLLKQQSDLWFRLLAGCGIFFLPMALLAGILFDATHALNPVFIISSISRTFLPYCGLVALFCLVGALLAVIASSIFILSSTQSLQQGIAQIVLVLRRLLNVTLTYPGISFTYLAMVTAHLLGRFYCRYKGKLGWGI